ncbi:nucleoside transporter C-terminal domain-containing protein [Utexia brackfieldae]|uniref:NupC/NupG family nucleoside CNT transporter n=1 Tax=Utexia brackfieldae TaxID=3074108 RepID=UPI00370DB43A
MHYFIGLISILVVLLLAWLACFDRKAIRYRYITIMILVQFMLAFILLNTSIGNMIIGSINRGFNYLLGYASEGVNFVFGGLVNQGEFNFFINVLLPIVFISALIGILQYCRILTLIIKGLGWLLSKVNGMGKLESYNAIAALILGQQEVFISIKKQLDHLPERRLYTLCTSAMSTVSMAIVGAYMTILKPEYVVIAIILNLFGGFIIASMINPYVVDEKEEQIEMQDEAGKQTFFQMLGEYIIDGFKVAIVVGAMLIGFIALIAMINGVFAAIFNITFVQVLGYLFSPFAFLIGVPLHECIDAAEIMATKLLANEFAAMTLFKEHIALFSGRSQAVISVFLVSFANFSSIGIISGALKALNERQGQSIAKHGLRLLFGASLVSLLSATIVSVVFDLQF